MGGVVYATDLMKITFDANSMKQIDFYDDIISQRGEADAIYLKNNNG